MEKRFQVFVSSTQQGCTPEKKEVIEALLELDCLPCSNDYFTSPDGQQWDLIEKMIGDSDFFLLVITNDKGAFDMPWIDKVMAEYDYADSLEKPVAAFVFDDEEDQEVSKADIKLTGSGKFESFKQELIDMAIPWSDVPELGALVSRQISQGKKYYPKAGWVRASLVQELLQRSKLSSSKIVPIEGGNEQLFALSAETVEDLAEGEEKVEVHIEVSGGPYNKVVVKSDSFTISWKSLAFHVLPKLMEPVRESTLRTYLNTIFRDLYLQVNKGKAMPEGFKVLTSNETFDTVKIQFQLLGFIKLYNAEIVKDEGFTNAKMVSLTEKGRQRMIEIRVARKGSL